MRLQLYTSNPDSLPQSRLHEPNDISLESAGHGYGEAARRIAYAGNEVGQALSQTEQLLAHQKQAEGQVEAEDAISKWDRALVDEDIRLRRDPQYDYLTHDQKLDEAGKMLMDQQASQMKTQTGVAIFKKSASRSLTEKVINAKYEAKKTLEGKLDSANQDANNRTAIDVVNTQDDQEAPPGQLNRFQEIKIAERDRLNQEAANRHEITPEQAGARTRQLRTDVNVILARKSMLKDPSQFLIYLSDAENWKDIPAKRREELEEQAVKMGKAQEEKEQRASAATNDAMAKHIMARQDAGVDTASEIYALSDSLRSETMDHLLIRNKKITKDGPKESNPVVLARLALGLSLGGNLRGKAAYAAINEAQPDLTTAHYLHFMNEADQRERERLNPPQSEAEKTRHELIKTNSKFLGTIFGVPGVADFDKEANSQSALAVLEFETRMAVEKNANPSAVQTEIMLRYAQGLRDQLDGRSAKTIEPLLRYKTEDELRANRSKFSSEEYAAQIRLLKYYNLLGTLGRPGRTAAPSGNAQPSEKPAEKSKPQPTGKPFAPSMGR